MVTKFLVRSLGVIFLVQLNAAQAQEPQLTPSTPTHPCSVNQTPYTEADVTNAQANLELWRNILRRMQNLAEAGVISRSQLDEAVHQERLARIRLELVQTASSPRARVTEAEAKAQLSQAQAELELRHREVQRLQVLANEGAISRSQLLNAVQEEQRARANLERSQACLRRLRP